MNLLHKVSLGAALLMVAMPVSARIYPDDFLFPSNSIQEPTPGSTSPTSHEPFFFASDIPDGNLTREEFVDAIATRLYDADMHDSCYGDLISSETVDYNLLFTDVSLDAPFATSLCLGMRNGLAQGYSDGTFRPNQTITVAEAAAALAPISGIALRDSNHMKKGEAWYQRFMEAMRSVDREFTMAPSAKLTGAELRHTLCVLEKTTPEFDPLNEFSGC